MVERTYILDSKRRGQCLSLPCMFGTFAQNQAIAQNSGEIITSGQRFLEILLPCTKNVAVRLWRKRENACLNAEPHTKSGRRWMLLGPFECELASGHVRDREQIAEVIQLEMDQ